MALILVVVFIVACLGFYFSVFAEEEHAESQFIVFFFPCGGHMQWDRVTGDAVMWGADPQDWINWKTVGDSKKRNFNMFPSEIELIDGWDNVTYQLEKDGNVVEIARECYW